MTLKDWRIAPADIPQREWDKGLQASIRQRRGYPHSRPEEWGQQICEDLAGFRNALRVPGSTRVDHYALTAYYLARGAHWYWRGRLVTTAKAA